MSAPSKRSDDRRWHRDVYWKAFTLGKPHRAWLTILEEEHRQLAHANSAVSETASATD